MIQKKYSETLEEFDSIVAQACALSTRLRDERLATQSFLDSMVWTKVMLVAERGRRAVEELDELLKPCAKGGRHFWSEGACAKCGEPLDAYAAARKEAR